MPGIIGREVSYMMLDSIIAVAIGDDVQTEFGTRRGESQTGNGVFDKY